MFERLRGRLRLPVSPGVRSFERNLQGAEANGNPEEFLASALREIAIKSAKLKNPDCETRQTLRQVCEAAHACDTSVEALLILLKQTWMELPQALCGHHAEAQAALSGIISICREEYFDAQRPA